jgi:exonuclease SbcD
MSDERIRENASRMILEGETPRDIAMRILHTADWHIGRTLDGNDLHGEQRIVLDQIVEMANEKNPDVIVIAGDLFDLPSPSADSQNLCHHYIIELGKIAPVLIIPGNHDSRNRFKAIEGFAEATNIHITSQIDEVVARAFEFEEGSSKVRIYGIPFVAPNLVRGLEGFKGIKRTHRGVVTSVMEEVREDAEAHDARIIAIAHLFITGGKQSKSKAERDIEFGGVHDIKASAFEGADLVMLGHLHRCHTPHKQVPVTHYSGSILRYSFGEFNHDKSCSIIDYNLSTGESVIENIELNLPRGMARLSGSSVQDVLENPDYDEHVNDWVEVTLPWSERGTNPLVRMHTKFPYTSACIKFYRPTTSQSGAVAEAIQGESVGDQATTFFENVAGKGKATAERIAIVTEMDEEIRGEGA